VSCLILARIRETRDDAKEAALAAQSWKDLDETQLPACVSERGAFMAPYSYSRMLPHPYSKTSQAHAHFLPTPFRYPPYAAPCIPFNWMLKEGYAEKVKAFELGFVPELEAQAHQAMGFETNWVQTKHTSSSCWTPSSARFSPNSRSASSTLNGRRWSMTPGAL
jgi:hypothetical protein